MDDIICPECGRPNLKEGKKCWYCQTDLKPEDVQEPSDDPNIQPKTVNDIQPQQNDVEEDSEETEEVPEWLAKIRKKIEAERGPEEELPHWKQKDIFGGEKKIEKNTPKPVRKKKTVEVKSDSMEKGEIDNPSPEIVEQENDDSGFEDLSNDLPDGFKKI